MLLVLSLKGGEFQREVERGRGRFERRVGDKIVLLGDMRPMSVREESHQLTYKIVVRGREKGDSRKQPT